MTQDVLGELFGVQQPVANKWIHRLLPVLNRRVGEFVVSQGHSLLARQMRSAFLVFNDLCRENSNPAKKTTAYPQNKTEFFDNQSGIL